MSLKKHPFNFNFGNREKSHEAKSGEYSVYYRATETRSLNHEKNQNHWPVIVWPVGTNSLWIIPLLLKNVMNIAEIGLSSRLSSSNLSLPSKKRLCQRKIFALLNHCRTLAATTRMILMNF